LSNQINQQLGR